MDRDGHVRRTSVREVHAVGPVARVGRLRKLQLRTRAYLLRAVVPLVVRDGGPVSLVVVRLDLQGCAAAVELVELGVRERVRLVAVAILRDGHRSRHRALAQRHLQLVVVRAGAGLHLQEVLEHVAVVSPGELPRRELGVRGGASVRVVPVRRVPRVLHARRVRVRLHGELGLHVRACADILHQHLERVNRHRYRRRIRDARRLVGLRLHLEARLHVVVAAHAHLRARKLLRQRVVRVVARVVGQVRHLVGERY